MRKSIPKNKSKKEEIEVNVDEDVAALVDGEELSEAFKTKAATIFESAIKTKVRSELEKIQEENEKMILSEYKKSRKQFDEIEEFE